jgi:hypothetical protein
VFDRTDVKDAIYEKGRNVKFVVPPEDDAEIVLLPYSLLETMSMMKRIPCDCGLFVQLASRVLDDRNDNVLVLNDRSPADIVACACGRDLGYLRLISVSAHLNLQNTSLAGKGHWLIPLGSHKYLGILPEGIFNGNRKQWSEKAKQLLLSELHERESCGDLLRENTERWTEAKYLRILLHRGHLNRWTIDRLPAEAFTPERAAALRKMIQGSE